MKFGILTEVSDTETFAAGFGIRELARLRKTFGRGRWRKNEGGGAGWRDDVMGVGGILPPPRKGEGRAPTPGS
jgi:hypothetical protein